jgi:gamma-glutamylcyclotransferase
MSAFPSSAVPSTQPHRPETLYFAYGSNLHFEQLCKRCPESRFLGRGRLHKYEWQINDRGFANVIPARDPRSFVDGLCYLLSASDESSLDRNEGVPTAYQRCFLNIDFFSADVALLGRRVSEIIEDRKMRSKQQFLDQTAGPERDTRDEIRHAAKGQAGGQHRSWSAPERVDCQTKEKTTPARMTPIGKAEQVRALVYLSNVTKPSDPWDEYVDRMKLGLTEALSLGISQRYVDIDVRPLLNGRGPRPVKTAVRPYNGRKVTTNNRGRPETGPKARVGENRTRREDVSIVTEL